MYRMGKLYKGEIGELSVSGSTTSVFNYNSNTSTNRIVNMTYYYFDINVRHDQGIGDVWPTGAGYFNDINTSISLQDAGSLICSLRDTAKQFPRRSRKTNKNI